MGLFSKLFNIHPEKPEPDIQFGRFTDSYKSDEKYKHWDAAIDFFENEKYIAAYTQFLDFISNEAHKNVQFLVNIGKIQFTIYQGSKIITGEADYSKFKAEAKIVKVQKLNLGLMRFLLEQNFNLKYTKYAIDEDNNICLVFDTFVEDGSPHKIYQALKELATEADRKDDVLIDRFEDLLPINFNHTRQLSIEEKKAKFEFLRNKVNEVIDELNRADVNPNLYPGGVSFLLLDLLYSIDYLIKPEGFVMETIKECHDIYFNDKMTNVHDKNKEIIKKVKSLRDIDFIQLEKELYEVNSTFGTSMPEGHRRLCEIIMAQMTDLDWYTENNYKVYAQAICGYIVGFSLYSYVLPDISKALLKLYYRITENAYFISIGFKDDFELNGSINKTNVINSIKKIFLTYDSKDSGIKIDTNYLDFKDKCVFSKSYLMMINNMYYPE
ncbi:MAG: hypothetical protein IPO92_10995 [Saprospiraceae bacterium]|nr:hypothetical protein [Saprospiraceae bacterium]